MFARICPVKFIIGSKYIPNLYGHYDDEKLIMPQLFVFCQSFLPLQSKPEVQFKQTGNNLEIDLKEAQIYNVNSIFSLIFLII